MWSGLLLWRFDATVLDLATKLLLRRRLQTSSCSSEAATSRGFYEPCCYTTPNLMCVGIRLLKRVPQDENRLCHWSLYTRSTLCNALPDSTVITQRPSILLASSTVQQPRTYRSWPQYDPSFWSLSTSYICEMILIQDWHPSALTVSFPILIMLWRCR